MKYDNGDIDDLFRRASEKYPLRTDSADWDRLASALAGGAAPSSDQEKERRRRGVFWWFLLIPLAGVGYLTWQVRAYHSAEKGIVTAPAKGGAVADGGVAASKDGSAAVVRPVKVTTPVTGAGGGQDGNAVGSAVAGTAGKAAGIGNAGQAGSVVGSGNAGQARNAEVVRQASNISGERKVRNMRTGNAGGTDAMELSGTDAAGRDRKDAVGRDRTDVVANGGEVDHELVLAALDLRRASIGGRNPIDVNVVAHVTAAKNPPPPGPDKKKNSHGYIGVFGAPDFSTVHYQSMKGVGTTFGVLLGYSFNERWAVESGLYLDRKRYYTAGEYFNTEKVRMPTGYYKLLNVDGTCNMWEIPVNVRYNFSPSPRMKWFATAGLSTYLMTSENYTYQVQNNWNTEDSSWNIHRPSRYLFSIVNLSAGFEQRIGKIGNLRLEPYVRIPLSGIGTGSLPIMSAGLNIGFTRQLW